MFGLSWFRKLAFAERAIDLDRPVELEAFLRSAWSDSGDRPAHGRGTPGRLPLPERPRSGATVPADPPRPSVDALLDEALLETFPASDPIAVSPR
jgi:hypothetical protein